MNEGRFKFVSKSMNLSIVLDHAISEDKLSGRPAVPGFNVRFHDGTVVVSEEIAARLRLHPGFGRDYYEVAEETPNVYAERARSSEPEHMITPIEYGHLGKTISDPVKVKFTPQQEAYMKQIVAQEAAKLSAQMLPGLVKEVLQGVAGGAAANTDDSNGKDSASSPAATHEVETENAGTVTTTANMDGESLTAGGKEDFLADPVALKPEASFVCPGCGRVSKSNLGNIAHQRACTALHELT